MAGRLGREEHEEGGGEYPEYPLSQDLPWPSPPRPASVIHLWPCSIRRLKLRQCQRRVAVEAWLPLRANEHRRVFLGQHGGLFPV